MRLAHHPDVCLGLGSHDRLLPRARPNAAAESAPERCQGCSANMHRSQVQGLFSYVRWEIAWRRTRSLLLPSQLSPSAGLSPNKFAKGGGGLCWRVEIGSVKQELMRHAFCWASILPSASLHFAIVFNSRIHISEGFPKACALLVRKSVSQ